jgi:D-alanyl-D-alanine carboxypeptidase
MTIKHLLSHTSGVYSYLDDEEVYFDVVNNPSQLKTDKYLIKFALNKPASFMPGKQIYYSDTGYLLTGLILDEVLGEHHSKALRQRILLPLGLKKTYYKGIEKNKNEMIPGYFTNNTGRPIFEVNEIVNTKVLQDNIGAADAPLVSTVEELALLLKTTIVGSDIVTENIKEMLFGEENLNDMGYSWYGYYNAYYGKGMITEKFKGTQIYHHGGIGLGYNTNNIYIPEHEISVTSFANCGVSKHCDYKLHKMVTKILDAVVD